MLGQPVELVSLGLALVVAVRLDQRHKDVDQLLAARWMQAWLKAGVQGHGAVAGAFVHLLHELERAEGAALVRHEVAVGDHGLVEVVFRLDESCDLRFADH